MSPPARCLTDVKSRVAARSHECVTARQAGPSIGVKNKTLTSFPRALAHTRLFGGYVLNPDLLDSCLVRRICRQQLRPRRTTRRPGPFSDWPTNRTEREGTTFLD